MKADKLILLILLAIFLLKFVSGFPLDNTTIPGGTDVAHFFTNSWYIFTYGVTKWNYFWYGGFPFLRYYPPIAFLITAFIGKAFGIIFAYKFVNNLFLALSPIAFYFFAREFKLTREKEIIATLTFSFIPIFGYFFADGRFTTLINVFFALLYWKFLKRSLDGKKFIDISIAAIFLSISLLTHQTTTFLFIAISTGWALIYKTKIDTVKKLLVIGVLTLAITAWWFFPFFIDTFLTSKSSLFLQKVGVVDIGDITYRIQTSALHSAYYVSNLEPDLLIALAALLSILSIFSLTRYKDKTIRDFFLLSIFIVLMFFVVRYERSVIFLAVPVSFLVAEGFDVLKGKIRFAAQIFFILLLLASYLLIRPQVYPIPSYPNIPKDGRVIFFPVGSEYITSNSQMKNFYSVIFSPMNGQENIRGWHDESQLIGISAANKYSYILNVSDPLHNSKEISYTLLNAGYIDYVVVNNNATEYLNYFNDSRFRQIYSDNMFTAFQISPKSTYIEFNGNATQSDAMKYNDRIEIDTVCQKGILVIKESYNPNWHVSINDSPQKTTFNEYGFTKLDNTVEGNCRITLDFENPKYYELFYLISIATLVFILFNMFKKFL